MVLKERESENVETRKTKRLVSASWTVKLLRVELYLLRDTYHRKFHQDPVILGIIIQNYETLRFTWAVLIHPSPSSTCYKIGTYLYFESYYLNYLANFYFIDIGGIQALMNSFVFYQMELFSFQIVPTKYNYYQVLSVMKILTNHGQFLGEILDLGIWKKKFCFCITVYGIHTYI